MIEHNINKTGYSWYKIIKDNLIDVINGLPHGINLVKDGGIIFHGSITSGIDDEYTDLDMWLILDSKVYFDFVFKNGHFFDFEVEKKWGHINIENLDVFINRVSNCDFPLIYELRNGYFVHGNDSVLTLYKTAQKEINKDITENHFLYNYAIARNWQKSSENIIRRGDKTALLLTMSKFIEHALKAAIISNGRPYPYQKWLYHTASGIDSCNLLVNEIDLLLEIIERNGILGDVNDIDNNVLFKSMEKIKGALIDLASIHNIESPIIEKWYLYIDDIDSLIKDKKLS